VSDQKQEFSLKWYNYSDFKKKIFFAFGEGCYGKQIADMHDVSRSYVSQIARELVNDGLLEVESDGYIKIYRAKIDPEKLEKQNLRGAKATPHSPSIYPHSTQIQFRVLNNLHTKLKDNMLLLSQNFRKYYSESHTQGRGRGWPTFEFLFNSSLVGEIYKIVIYPNSIRLKPNKKQFKITVDDLESFKEETGRCLSAGEVEKRIKKQARKVFGEFVAYLRRNSNLEIRVNDVPEFVAKKRHFVLEFPDGYRVTTKSEDLKRIGDLVKCNPHMWFDHTPHPNGNFEGDDVFFDAFMETLDKLENGDEPRRDIGNDGIEDRLSSLEETTEKLLEAQNKIAEALSGDSGSDDGSGEDNPPGGMYG